jgi:endo-1,4-beta-D-glucanase Y
MKQVAILLFLFLLSSGAFAQNYPFPQNVTYPHGIKPNSLPQDEMNARVQELFETWRRTYVTADGCIYPDTKRIVMVNQNKDSNSEGISYGMFILLRMDNAVNQTREDFDALFRYYKSYVKTETHGLMRWRIDSTGVPRFESPAGDGDEEVAFQLILADRQWGSDTGPFNYLAEAKTILTNLYKFNVQPNFTFSDGNGTWFFPAYQMTPYMKEFATVTGNTNWNKVVTRAYEVFDYYYNNTNNINEGTGLIYNVLNPNTFEAVNEVRARYSYDAMRVPWRLANDYLWNGTSQSTLARDHPAKIANWAKNSWQGFPGNAYMQYTITGQPLIAFCNNFCDKAAMVGPMMVGAMAGNDQEWLNALYNYCHTIPIVRNYFADQLLLMTMITATGNAPSLPGGEPLVITRQPDSGATVCTGDEVTVSVEVSGTVESYQWYKDGVALTDVPSANTATLSLPAVTTNLQGSYTVVVTGSNTLTSTAFNLIVNTPPPAPEVESITVTQGAPDAVLRVTNCAECIISWNGEDGGTTLAVSTAETGTFTYIVVSKANGCESPATMVTVTVTGNLQVYHRDGSNSPTGNTIRPYLKLVNAGASSIPYGEITLRYWLTAEEFAPLTNLSVYWAQMGNHKVRMQYVPLSEPRAGAFGYVEYRFDATAGYLPGSSNSGEIQTGIAKQDWTPFNQTDDYSYANNTAYTVTDRITVYRNGTLIAGTEPAPVSPVTALKIYAENKNHNPTTNQLRPHLEIVNEGNMPVAYSSLTVRYWFTAEGEQPLVYNVDYWKLGNSNVQGNFVQENRQQADTYLELRFSSGLGYLHPSSATGQIQQRMHKTDWSAFHETNDYSYQAAGPRAENGRITAYLDGKLVYGQEPAVLSGARLAAGKETGGMQVVVLGNPVEGDLVRVMVNGVEGQPLQLRLTNLQGQVVAEQRVEKAVPAQQQQLYVGNKASGMLLLQVSTPGEKQTLKLIKH